jgi:hypothetical protein
MLSLGFLLFAIGSFLNFHKMRMERDQARQEVLDRFDAMRYRFALEGVEGHPAEGAKVPGGPLEFGYQFILKFRNNSTELMEFSVESLSIVMTGGHSADPNEHWTSDSGLIAPGGTYDFHYHWINAPVEPLLLGTGQYSIRYRRPGDPKEFLTRHKFEIRWTVPPGGPPQVRWLTVGKVTHERVLDDDSVV